MDNVYYVYLLIDPRNNEPFYVGKGKGGRMYQHARNVINQKIDNPIKQAVIQGILDESLEVQYQIDSDALNERDAFRRESELIKNIGITKLTNLVPGRADVLEQSKVWAQTQLSRVKPYEEWEIKTKPSLYHQQLYHQIVAELKDMAVNGWVGEFTVTM